MSRKLVFARPVSEDLFSTLIVRRGYLSELGLEGREFLTKGILLETRAENAIDHHVPPSRPWTLPSRLALAPRHHFGLLQAVHRTRQPPLPKSRPSRPNARSPGSHFRSRCPSLPVLGRREPKRVRTFRAAQIWWLRVRQYARPVPLARFHVRRGPRIYILFSQKKRCDCRRHTSCNSSARPRASSSSPRHSSSISFVIRSWSAIISSFSARSASISVVLCSSSINVAACLSLVKLSS